MNFKTFTSVVLTLASTPWTEQVKTLRKLYEPARFPLSLGIAITGSGGVGTIRTEQSPEETFHALDTLAGRVTPIITQFRAENTIYHSLYQTKLTGPKS